MAETNRVRKNLDLNCENVKKTIFKYLYSHELNHMLSYDIINNFSDINSIKEGDYIICPKYEGTRSWILFFYDKNTEVYYAVNFPKHNIRKRNEIRIFPLDIQANPIFYLGSIMEGIYYKYEDTKYLIIDEVYYFAGEDQSLKSKDARLNFITNNLKHISYASNKIYIHVSKYYNINKSSLTELFNIVKTDDRVQELTFYPRNIGSKIYTYAIKDDDLIDHVITVGIYVMQKTSKTEVYNMIVPKSKDKIGIAYIPNMETSKKCKKWFTNNKKKELLVKFQKDSVTKKWIPVELVETDINSLE